MNSEYLKIGKVFSHEVVDLTDRKASCFAVLQSHEDQDARGEVQAQHACIHISVLDFILTIRYNKRHKGL